MLRSSQGRLLTLYIELKGATADRQMAEDTVRMIQKYGMEEETVLISLKYDLIDYIETTYPQMYTGYPVWASYGDIASLRCDYIGFEQEAVTDSLIRAVHEEGKDVLVWIRTPNKDSALSLFRCGRNHHQQYKTGQSGFSFPGITV